MERIEIKKLLKEKEIDRRDLAQRLNITPSHLSSMLNGWAPLKEEYETAIAKELTEVRTE